MSTTPPERRAETSAGDRSASQSTESTPSNQSTRSTQPTQSFQRSEPSDPARTSQFRPFGSSTPTTATPVGRPDSASGGASTSEWEDPEDTGPQRLRHVVDRFDGAAGLLALRLVTAAVLAIRGLQKLQHLDVTRAQFGQLGIPYPDTMAVVVGGCEFAIAFALIVGALVRLAGLGIAIITIGALVYVKWRTGDIFTAGQPGFSGELELLLAGVGIAFLGLGGGGWGVDKRFRRR